MTAPKIRIFALGDLINTDDSRPIQGMLVLAAKKLEVAKMRVLQQTIMARVKKLRATFLDFNMGKIQPESLRQKVNEMLFADLVDGDVRELIAGGEFWPIWNSMSQVDAASWLRLEQVRSTDYILSSTNEAHLRHLSHIFTQKMQGHLPHQMVASCNERLSKVELYQRVIGFALQIKLCLPSEIEVWFGDPDKITRDDERKNAVADIEKVTAFAVELGIPLESLRKESAQRLVDQQPGQVERLVTTAYMQPINDDNKPATDKTVDDSVKAQSSTKRQP